MFLNRIYSVDIQSKKVREKSRECHNHKTQPFPDPKRKTSMARTLLGPWKSVRDMGSSSH